MALDSAFESDLDSRAPFAFRPLAASAREVLSAPLSPELPANSAKALRSVVLAARRFVRVAGAERLAAIPEPAIFALNHTNAFEAVVAPASLIWLRGGRPLAMLADWMYLELPLLGAILKWGEPIPVFRKRARWGWREERRQRGLGSSAVERCLATLASGRSVGLFPEGTRNREVGRLLPARSGLGEIAAASGVPIVPVGITYPAAARLGRVPRLGRLDLTIGAPLVVTDLEADLLSIHPVEATVARRLSDRTMAALADLAGCAPTLEGPAANRVSPRFQSLQTPGRSVV